MFEVSRQDECLKLFFVHYFEGGSVIGPSDQGHVFVGGAYLEKFSKKTGNVVPNADLLRFGNLLFTEFRK